MIDSSRPSLGVWPAAALVIGHTIGVGIFLTPAELIGALASPVLTLGLWTLSGALVLAGAFTFGELASRYPEAGGPYIYLREGFGPGVAFLYAWQSLLVMDPGVTAALTAGAAQYLVPLWPQAAGAERAVAVALIWSLALANMGGLTLSARLLGALTALKLLALAAIVVLAFTAGSGSWTHFTPFMGTRVGAPPLAEALALGLVGVFFSFGGFWEASRIAGEVRDPRRTLAAGLALGVAAITFVYVATTFAFMYLVAPQEVTSAAAFAQRAGEAMLGPKGPIAFSSVVVLSVVASAMALLMMAPRLYLAMSRDGLFPATLAALNPRTQAPARATAFLATLASVFVLAGTLQDIIALCICTSMGFIGLAAASLFVLRRQTTAAAAFRAPGYPVSTALFVLFVAVVVLLVAIGRPRQAITGFGIVLLGVPVYVLFKGEKLKGRS